MLEKLSSLEESNPKEFWKNINLMKNNNVKDNNVTNIPASIWFNHFKSLSTKKFSDETISAEIKTFETKSLPYGKCPFR